MTTPTKRKIGYKVRVWSATADIEAAISIFKIDDDGNLIPDDRNDVNPDYCVSNGLAKIVLDEARK